MRSVTPSIESAVSRLAPGFRALSIVVESAPVADPAVAEQALAEACLAVQQDDVPWAQAHLAAWDEAFSAFGAKAKRTPCSARSPARWRSATRSVSTTPLFPSWRPATTCG